ncbi:hypothetical protein RF819_02775 [Rhodoferax fermentans]|uniref:Uncharacterized protein n=1 Tax=Rhodoferax fermentans TaxID=28066 RepID=A0A1T1AP56_RHOFE|nr:hypothetical protein RF819_02775 [Rhodoferax fermentans]
MRLDRITGTHRIFDGVEYVNHDGLVAKGRKATVGVDGVFMTPEHEVLDSAGNWVRADALPTLGRRVEYREGHTQDVYDIVNCGPRSRFAVLGDTGLVICHNCLERGHHDFLAKADKCDKFFAGDQWDVADLNALQLARRPSLTINKIISTVSTIMGQQIYNRNEVSYRPAGEGANSEVADALQKVWAQIAASNQLNWVRSDVAADGFIRSRGFYDVRLDFTDNLKGEVRITNLNGKNVVIDPDAEQYDPDEWNDVFVTKWLTYQDIATLYNQDDADYLKMREESLFPYAYDSIERVRDRFAGSQLTGSYYGLLDTAHVRRNIRTVERQYRKLDSQKHFVDVQTGDARPVPESWDRNRIAALLERTQGQLTVLKKKVKRIRWTVTADNVVLHDDWSPYKHFTPVPYFPHFHHGRTIGLVENLLGSQELLNKSSSQELHVINTSANSGWIVKTGTLVNMEVEDLEQSGAKTGLVIEVNGDTEKDVKKITPNSIPQGMDRISYKAEEHMKSISGVSDSMQGFDREDVAAKAITAKRQSGQANLVRVLDNLERTDYFLARNVLDLVQEYYTEERIIHITGNDLVNSPQTLTVNQYDPATDTIINDLTLGEYGIIITAQPDRATLEDSQFEQAKSLKELGIAIPDDVLIENSRLMRRGEIVKQMQAEAQSPEAQQKKALEMRAMEANVSKLEGEAQEKHTKSALDTARTEKETVETQNLAQGGDNGEAAKLQQELQIERERFEMERQERQEKLQFEREQAAIKLQQMREEHALKQQIQQEDAQARRAQQAQQAEQNAYAQRAQAEKSESSPTTTKE